MLGCGSCRGAVSTAACAQGQGPAPVCLQRQHPKEGQKKRGEGRELFLFEGVIFNAGKGAGNVFSRVTVCTQIALEAFSVGSERAPSHQGAIVA